MSKKNRHKGKLSDAIKALQFFFSLDKVQRNIVWEKQIQDELVASKWLTILPQLATFDKHGDSGRSAISLLIRILRIASLVLGIIYLIGVALIVETDVEKAFDYPYLWGWYFIIFLFLTTIPLRVLLNLMEGIDLPNTFRLFLVPLMSILEKETGEFDLVSIRMDLRDNDNKKFKTKRDKNYKWAPHRVVPLVGLALCIALIVYGGFYPPAVSGYDFKLYGCIGLFAMVFVWMFMRSVLFGVNPKLITTYYQIPMLDLSTRLSDGTLLRIEIGEELVKRFVWRSRTNARGKIKIKRKTKFKKKITTSVRLGFSNKTYQIAEKDIAWGDAKKTKFKEGEKRNVVGYRLVEKQNGQDGHPDFKRFLETISKGAYKNINLAN